MHERLLAILPARLHPMLPRLMVVGQIIVHLGLQLPSLVTTVVSLVISQRIALRTQLSKQFLHRRKWQNPMVLDVVV